MRKIVLLLAAMALAVLLSSMVAVLAAVPGDAQTTVTLVGAGDIASCNYTQDSATAKLLGNIPGTVLTLGDNAYTYGTAAEFKNCYDPTWGSYKMRTRPTAGNHDYYTAGAKPYFDYFGWWAGRPGRGYYSYDRGSWHILALNSNCAKLGGSGRDSAQGRWLRNTLANHRSRYPHAKCEALLARPLQPSRRRHTLRPRPSLRALRPYNSLGCAQLAERNPPVRGRHRGQFGWR